MKVRQMWIVLAACGLFALVAGSALGPLHGWAQAQSTPVNTENSDGRALDPAAATKVLYMPVLTREQQAGKKLYMPILVRKNRTASLFGVEMDKLNSAHGLEQMSSAGAFWLRRNALLWSSVEPTKGTRDWTTQATLEAELKSAAARGMKVILIVRSTPSWAQKVAGYSCGPVSSTELSAFGDFMGDVVARYSQPPYNVQYYELWNEPDIAPSLVDPDNFYGCWGDESDTSYYGGGYYGEMLKAVYQKMKTANTNAQVLIGGLVLDCNPDVPGACSGTHNPIPARFLEGILVDGAGDYFDGVSFHAYDFYQGSGNYYSNPLWNSAWNTTGPVVAAKAQFIRDVLNRHNVQGKFLMDTEAAMMFYGGICNVECEQIKAMYVGQAYATAYAQQLRANIWYSALGWRESGLLYSDLSPRPAYNAYTFGRTMLQNATLIQEDKSYQGVKSYQFTRLDRQVWVMWTLGGNIQVSLPGIPTTIYQWDSSSNQYIGFPGAQVVNLNELPTYFEWMP